MISSHPQSTHLLILKLDELPGNPWPNSAWLQAGSDALLCTIQPKAPLPRPWGAWGTPRAATTLARSLLQATTGWMPSTSASMQASLAKVAPACALYWMAAAQPPAPHPSWQASAPIKPTDQIDMGPWFHHHAPWSCRPHAFTSVPQQGGKRGAAAVPQEKPAKCQHGLVIAGNLW